jgi:hypothetical protein
VSLGVVLDPLYGFVCDVILLQFIFCISLLAFLLGRRKQSILFGIG